MRELAHRIKERVRAATAAIRTAEESGDDFAAQVYRGELDSLRRIAQRHGLSLPDQTSGPAQPTPGSSQPDAAPAQ
mgnify:CR=1 FL=1